MKYLITVFVLQRNRHFDRSSLIYETIKHRKSNNVSKKLNKDKGVEGSSKDGENLNSSFLDVEGHDCGLLIGGGGEGD